MEDKAKRIFGLNGHQNTQCTNVVLYIYFFNVEVIFL